jgi:Ni,Fe-hydrogenase maturation factor
LKPSARLSSLHQIDFATACELAKNMEIAFPKEIAIFVMEVEDEFSFGEKPTPKVEAAIPKMAVAVINILEDRGWIPVS